MKGGLHPENSAVLTLLSLLQSEKLTKHEVEAKFCNFSLSINSVSVASCNNSQSCGSELILTHKH